MNKHKPQEPQVPQEHQDPQKQLQEKGFQLHELEKANAIGLSFGSILQLIQRFGPQVVKIIQELLGSLATPVVPPTPAAAPAPPAPRSGCEGG